MTLPKVIGKGVKKRFFCRDEHQRTSVLEWLRASRLEQHHKRTELRQLDMRELRDCDLEDGEES